MRRSGGIVRLALALTLIATSALAQGGPQTASVAGVVIDPDGGVVPGATVHVTNTATGESLTGATNATGVYSFPGLAPGAYTVTVSLPGFKTVEHQDVRLLAGSANNLTTRLALGPIAEVVRVAAGTDLVRTQSPTITSTINVDFIQTLPRYDRNALNFLIFLPGVTTIGGADNAVYNDCGGLVPRVQTSTVSGLPNNTINVTIDGISTSDMRSSCNGFFSMVTPRLDAIEQVSLTTSTAGADASGQGAVQVRFVTRTGSNRFDASLYAFMQHKALNSNTYFNRLNGLPRLQATNVTYGGRVGGPIVIPKVFDGRGRAFFFFNQEEVYNPTDTARERTIIREAALNGNFTYNLDNPTTVNLWTIAAASGQTATYDPVIRDLLLSIRAAAQTTGTIQELTTSPNTATFNYLVPSRALQHAPTANVTVNVTPNHRVQGSYYWQRFSDTPDVAGGAEPTFPGFPLFGIRSSYRTTASLSLRSIVSASMVNELRGGWQWSPFDVYANTKKDMFANQGGYDLFLYGGLGLDSAWPPGANYPNVRNTANWTLDDTFNWLKGAHSLTFGGNFTRVFDWAEDWQNVPDISFGVDSTDDPAEVMFGTGSGQSGLTNFPGASPFDLWTARDLYALLTGRVTSIVGGAYLNEAGTEYVYNGRLHRSEHMDEYAVYAQDQWRWKPNVTITAGLRYQLQLPVTMTSGVFTTMSAESACGPSGFAQAPQGRFCNIFNPGVLNNPGVIPGFYLYSKGTKGYNTDYNNVAPNVGVSWQPRVQRRWLRTLLGDPEQATVSAGYTRSFNRERLDRFLSVYHGNPGQYLPANRGTSGYEYPLVLPGESWPLLFRDTSRLGPPDFPTVPSFPINPFATEISYAYAQIFDPHIEIPYTDSWSASFQRSVGRDSAIEVRYIGNINQKPWAFENWNTVNIYETGLFDEFRLAQANLHANVLAGRGGTFAYFGPGTGTNPLPIFLAHFSALPAAAAANPGSYTVAGGGAGAVQWNNAQWVSRLDPFFPNPSSIASQLYRGSGGRWFSNAKAAGYPINFWVMNPLVSASSVLRNRGGSRTDQLIVEFRRRLSGGFAASGSYTWSRTITKSNLELHLPLFDLQSEGVPHAFKLMWTYDLPVGRGRRIGSNMSAWLDGVLGGWMISGTGRVQVQSFVLRNSVLVGMTHKEAQQAFKTVRYVTDPVSGAVTVWNMPQDIIDNTRRAYNTNELLPDYYAPGQEPTGRYFAPASSLACPVLYPGDCGIKELWFHGRWFGEFDFRIAKRFNLPGKARLEFGAEVFNGLMAKNFETATFPSSSPDVFRITDTQSGPRTAQLSWRISW